MHTQPMPLGRIVSYASTTVNRIKLTRKTVARVSNQLGSSVAFGNGLVEILHCLAKPHTDDKERCET